ncbi:SHOCT domain-containing protein [Amycolatopsis kentuckyensis]|uniref:SHOCT domain-containing protein n=1 Tax=Amycolatopsis kentuckyensis TaxID=218823 RepID=UPI00142E0471|nr:SHOCT domain-containing protein [Amycolatopsis kentuckyensis]
MPYWYHSGAMGWFGGVGMLVLLALVLATLVALVVVLARRGPQPEPGGTARRILDERFARGEIDQEEYEQRRDALTRTK